MGEAKRRKACGDSSQLTESKPPKGLCPICQLKRPLNHTLVFAQADQSIQLCESCFQASIRRLQASQGEWVS